MRPSDTEPPVPCRVLLVEDHAASRNMLRLLLELSGFEVEEAGDGREGVRKALDWHPDVAVLDIDLPLLDGYEVARQVKVALGDQVRLIALTGHGSPEDRRRALEGDFDVHLTKPADLDELCHHLHPPP